MKSIVTSIMVVMSSLMSVFFYVNESITGILFFIAVSAIFFYGSIKSDYKNRVVNDFVLMFPAVFLIYTTSYPLFRYSLNIISVDIIQVSNHAIRTGTLLSGLTINAYIVLVMLFYRGKKFDFSKWDYFKMGSNHIVFDMIAGVFLAQYSFNFIATGGLSFLSTGISRVEVGQLFSLGRFWIMKFYFICYSGYTLISIMNNNDFISKYRFVNIVRLASIAIFWGISLLLGNRREIVYLLLMIVLYISTKKNTILRPRHAVMMLFSVAFILLWGYFRTAVFLGGVIYFENLVLASFGDFFFPIQSLYHYIDNPPVDRKSVV